MNLNVNQENLYLFLPSKVCRMAEMLTEEKNIGIPEDVKEIYLSDTYKILEDESTKLWHWGPVDLYDNMTREREQKE